MLSLPGTAELVIGHFHQPLWNLWGSSTSDERNASRDACICWDILMFMIYVCPGLKEHGLCGDEIRSSQLKLYPEVLQKGLAYMSCCDVGAVYTQVARRNQEERTQTCTDGVNNQDLQWCLPRCRHLLPVDCILMRENMTYYWIVLQKVRRGLLSQLSIGLNVAGHMAYESSRVWAREKGSLFVGVRNLI